MRNLVVLCAVVACFVGLRAETRLSGEIQSSSLDASGNPYIVEKDIVVPAGKKLTIKEGCVFLFNPFTGLNVNGNLSVEGSAQRPVVFSCVNDGDFNPKSPQIPNPFDWNGIIVSKESGSVHFQNFQLRYSVYGIKSQNASITVSNGLFRQNGQFHFTLNDKIQYVQDNISYSYKASPADIGGDSTGSGKGNGEKGSSPTRNIIRYSCLAVGVAGLAIGAIYAIQANNSANTINTWDIKKHPDLSEYQSEKDKLRTENTIAGVSFVFGGIGLVGFIATFVF